MAIALVQTKKGNGGGYVNSNAITLTSSVTAGNTLILGFTAGYNNSIASITDNQSNTWTLIANNPNSSTTDRRSWLYYAQNVAGGSTTITIVFTSGQFADSSTIVREYSGLATTSVLDQFATGNSGTGYVNSHTTSATATTTQANELVVAFVGSGGSASPAFSAGSGYGNITEQQGFDLYTYSAMEDKIVAATGTQTGTFGSTAYVRSQTIVATFKEAVAPTSNTTNFFQFI